MAIIDSIIFWIAFFIAVFWTVMSFRYYFMSSGHSSSRLVAIAMWVAIWFFKENPTLHEVHLLWVFPAILISWLLLSLAYGFAIQAIGNIRAK